MLNRCKQGVQRRGPLEGIDQRRRSYYPEGLVRVQISQRDRLGRAKAQEATYLGLSVEQPYSERIDPST